MGQKYFFDFPAKVSAFHQIRFDLLVLHLSPWLHTSQWLAPSTMLNNQIIDKETKYWKSIYHSSDVNVVAMWTHLETVGAAARDTRVKAATDLSLSFLVTSSSTPARVSRLRPSRGWRRPDSAWGKKAYFYWKSIYHSSDVNVKKWFLCWKCPFQLQLSQPFLEQLSKSQCPSSRGDPEDSKTPPTCKVCTKFGW